MVQLVKPVIGGNYPPNDPYSADSLKQHWVPTVVAVIGVAFIAVMVLVSVIHQRDALIERTENELLQAQHTIAGLSNKLEQSNADYRDKNAEYTDAVKGWTETLNRQGLEIDRLQKRITELKVAEMAKDETTAEAVTRIDREQAEKLEKLFPCK